MPLIISSGRLGPPNTATISLSSQSLLLAMRLTVVRYKKNITSKARGKEKHVADRRDVSENETNDDINDDGATFYSVFFFFEGGPEY